MVSLVDAILLDTSVHISSDFILYLMEKYLIGQPPLFQAVRSISMHVAFTKLTNDSLEGAIGTESGNKLLIINPDTHYIVFFQYILT